MRLLKLHAGKLTEIKLEKFDLEKTIQKMVESNLGRIFPGLQYVDTEFQINDLRPDTIAFDPERNSFVIIEIKNTKNDSLIDQGVSYHQLLHEKKADFVLLYNKKTNSTLGTKDINWNETRVIFISPKYTKYQKRASGFQGLPIELYEIKKYNDGIISLDRITATERGDLAPAATTSTGRSKPIKYGTTAYTEEDYLARAPETIKKLWRRLRAQIEDSFDDIEYKQTKYYGKYAIRDTGSSICTLEVFKSKIQLSYITHDPNIIRPDAFVRDMEKTGHRGGGRFCSTIRTEDNVQQAVRLVRNVYLAKKK